MTTRRRRSAPAQGETRGKSTPRANESRGSELERRRDQLSASWWRELDAYRTTYRFENGPQHLDPLIWQIHSIARCATFSGSGARNFSSIHTYHAAIEQIFAFVQAAAQRGEIKLHDPLSGVPVLPPASIEMPLWAEISSILHGGSVIVGLGKVDAQFPDIEGFHEIRLFDIEALIDVLQRQLALCERFKGTAVDPGDNPFGHVLVDSLAFTRWAEAQGIVEKRDVLHPHAPAAPDSVEGQWPAQQSAILAELARQKFDAHHLWQEPGKPGPKAVIKKILLASSPRLFPTPGTFDKAWIRCGLSVKQRRS